LSLGEPKIEIILYMDDSGEQNKIEISLLLSLGNKQMSEQ